MGSEADCGPLAPSRRAKVRAAVLITVHLLMIAHFVHWKLGGTTLTPLEPSESQQLFTDAVVNAGLIFFGLTLVLTLVFGRFFCGWACHVVAYQDFCAWLLGKLGARPKAISSRLLAIVPLYAAFDMFVWPAMWRLLRSSPGPELTTAVLTDDFWKTFPGPGMGLLTLVVCGGLTVWFFGAKGFCTYACPYGALFGMADRPAKGRIRVTDACNGCGHCTRTCTSNVKVHEEVRLYQMVVDSGCMKCLDCVSVCPRDALYYGFGKSALVQLSPPPASRKRYDFSWPEEILMAGVFVLALLAFRGLYHSVPFLLSLSIGIICAFGAVVLLRMVRRREVQLQRLPLKRQGKVTRTGLIIGFGIVSLLALGAHGARVKYYGWQAERQLAQAQQLPKGDPERKAFIRRSRASLLESERAGLVPDVVLQQQLGETAAALGDVSDAKQRMRQAVLIDPDWKIAWWWLYYLAAGEIDGHMRSERADAARGALLEAETALTRLIELDPRYRGASDSLVELQQLKVRLGS